MIDLHSHILPEVDDGASSLTEAIEILKAVEAKGVKQIAATPHYPLYQDGNYKEYINEKLDSLRKKAAAENLKLEILSGSEIFIDKKTPELLYKKQLIPINKTDYFLLETGLSKYPTYFLDIIHDLKAMGAEIIIAHPERYHYIQKDHTILYQWLEEYNLKLIFNSSSFLGHHGPKTKKTAEKLLCLGLGHLMASDTHGINKRPFSLVQGLKQAEAVKKGSSKIFKANAEAVLNNQQLQNFEIKREEKSLFKKFFSFLN